jgi:integrase
MRLKLTQTFIAGLRPDPRRTYDVWDTQQSGLVVRVRPSGSHSYLVRLKDPDSGNWYWYTLGSCKDLTADGARETAAIARGQAAKARLGVGGDPRTEARRRRKQAEEARRRSLTLMEFLRDTYEPWATVNRKTGTDTIARIKSRFDDLLNTPLAELVPFTLERWRMARRKARKSPATINRDIAALKGCLRHAVRSGAISVNPLTAAADFIPLKVERFGHKLRCLEPGEEKRLLAALAVRDDRRRDARASANQWRRERGVEPWPEFGAYTDHLTPLVTLLLHTGLRFGEACSLTWGDVDLTAAMLTVRGETAKSSTTRHVPLNRIAKDTLKAWRPAQFDANDYVFPGRKKGERLVEIKTAWRQLLRSVKGAPLVGFRVHDLRHTFASKLVRAGIDLNTVRELLGHADIKMTLRYAHLAPEHRAAAVAVLC